KTAQAGFVFYDPPGEVPHEPLAGFLDSGSPPITFTLGSTAVMNAGGFFQESRAAARSVGRRALLLMGKNALPATAPRELLALEYAPHSGVFARSACVVHHGGVGTTAQALRAGVPQLVMPYAFAQPDNAARVPRLGVAVSMNRRHYKAATAARDLDRLLSTPVYAERAREAGRCVSNENGTAVA